VTVVNVLAVMFVAAALRGEARGGGIPLSSLAGSFAGQGAASFGLCFNADLSSQVACSTLSSNATSIVTFVEHFTSQVTYDSNGNSCNELVGSYAPRFPGPEPAATFDIIQVSVTTDYNSNTGSGDSSFTQYKAGLGVTCNGAVLVNTGNASEIGAGTSHFVVSKNGNRIDAALKTFQNPTGAVAGDVAHGTADRQETSGENHHH